MRKFLKRFPFKKVFVYLFILFYTFFPSLHAAGVTLENNILENTETDESEDILNEGISDPEWIAKPLYTYEDGIYTVDLVQEGQYTYPDNEDVRVMFTSVTEEGNLTINKIVLSEDEKIELNTTDDYAWEITSNMSNGSFKYNLTLPNTLGNTDVEVMYTEDGEVYESVDNVKVNEGVIYIEGLDHFTVFVLTEKPPLETKEEKDDKRREAECRAWIKEIGTSTYFNTIQDAISKSDKGNTVYIEEGRCVENIVIDKSLTLTGKGKTILEPEITSQPIIKISTDDVTVENFTLQGSETDAILVTGASSVTIKNNSFLNNYRGVLIRQSKNVLIEDNSFNKGSLGLSIGHARDAKDSSTGNTVKGNVFSNLNPSGGATPIISLLKTSKNTIEGNKITTNRTQGGGISLSGSDNNIIKGNGITDNNVIPFGEGLVYGVGINLFSSGGNSITGNKIINHNSGIDLSASGRNSIEENILDSNWHGIYLRGDDCTKNTITKNQITNNKTIGIEGAYKGTGIYFFQSTSNNGTEIKYNNFSGNEDKAIRYEGKEVLDATLNWWGDKRGPSTTVSEKGEVEEKGMIKYQEWLCEPYETDWISSNGVCVGAPEQIGYNVKDGTPNVVPTSYSCEGGYTRINGVSIHWSDSINKGTNLWYERQYSRNGRNWAGSENHSNLFTDYKSFGYGEVPHFSRVRAFYDINENKQYDKGEPVSDWSNTCSITYDKTKPEGSIDHIYYSSKEIKVEDFITNDKNPTLGGTCFDSIGLDTVKLEINGEEQDLSCTNREWTSESFGTLADGRYQARLTLTDLAGNEVEKFQEIIIDTKPPTATHRYYKGNQEITNQPAYVKSTSELSFGAEYSNDGSGIFQDSYVIFDSNNEGTARTSKAYCSWRGTKNTLIITENPLVSYIPFSNCTVALSDGAYFMYHQVYDNAIRKDIPPIKQFRDYKGLYFIIDNISPKSTFNNNLTDTFHSSSILLEGTTTDENNVDYVTLYYSVAGEKAWTKMEELKNSNSSSAFDWSYSWVPTEEGIYDIYASGTDLAGNEEQSAFLYSVVYDITDPEISLVNLINGVLGEITADCGLSGLESIEIKVGDGEWEDYKEGMNLNDMVNRTPGTYIVHIKVRDKAGNKKETQRTFTIPAPFSDTLGEVLGALTEPFTPQPVQAQTRTSATTQLLAQSTQEEELPETEEEAESSETEQKEETKDIQEKEVKSEDGEEEEKGGLKWWVYILILLPLLFFFLTLYKRRKEEEEK